MLYLLVADPIIYVSLSSGSNPVDVALTGKELTTGIKTLKTSEKIESISYEGKYISEYSDSNDFKKIVENPIAPVVATGIAQNSFDEGISFPFQENYFTAMYKINTKKQQEQMKQILRTMQPEDFGLVPSPDTGSHPLTDPQDRRDKISFEDQKEEKDDTIIIIDI